MFFPKCGELLPDGTAYCSHCGQPTGQQEKPQQTSYQPQQPSYQAQQTNYQPQQPSYQAQQNNYQPQQPAQPPMKWFKFLIYFSLFAGAVLNVINAFSFFTGSQYGIYTNSIYAAFDGLQALDIFCGISLLAMAVLCIVTRFRLAGYYRNGPTMLYINYAAVVAYDVIYLIGLIAVLQDDFMTLADPTTLIGNMVVNLVMVFANMSYFKKRSHLFVK